MSLKDKLAAFSAKVRYGDKVLHFIAGIVVAALFIAAGYPNIASLAAIVVGILKEVYDKKYPDKHTADVYDAVATGAGGIFAHLTWLNTIAVL